MLLSDLTLDWGVSDGHTSHPEKDNIRFELKFNKPFPVALTCLLYLEFNNSVHVDFARIIMTDF